MEGFYSHAENVIRDKLPNVAHPDQVRATLIGNGVKQDEMKWGGIDEHLAKASGPIKKADLLATVRNAPKLEESIKSNSDNPLTHEEETEYNSLAASVDAAFGIPSNWTNERKDRFKYLDEKRSTAPSGLPVAYGDSSLQLPGGSNYKELLLKLPIPQHVRDNPAIQDVYHTSHWPDDPNTLVHVRFNDRVGPQGEKLLHLEEVQSDWAQAARKKRTEWVKQLMNASKLTKEEAEKSVPSNFGYKSSTQPDFSKWKATELGGGYSGGRDVRIHDEHGTPVVTFRNARADSHSLIDTAAGNWLDEQTKKVPDAPFKPTEEWSTLALKRMLRMAAEHGYHGISWTPGRDQVRRYPGLSPEQEKGHLKYYDEMLPNYLNKLGKKFGTRVGTTKTDSKDIKPFTNPEMAAQMLSEGTPIIAEAEDGEQYRLNTLDDLLQHKWKNFTRDPWHSKPIYKNLPYMPIPEAMRQEILTKGQRMYKKPGVRRYAMTQSIPGALVSVQSTNQGTLADVAKDITTSLRLTPAVGTDVIHQTDQGARPSMMLKFNHAGNTAKAAYASAWMGLMTKQPGMVVFNPGEGMDLLHTLQANIPGNKLNGVLRRYGIRDSVLVPQRNGFRVVLYDKDAKLGMRIQALARELRARLQSQRGTGSFIGAPEEHKAREAYRHVIRTYESQQEQPVQKARAKTEVIEQPRPSQSIKMARHVWEGHITDRQFPELINYYVLARDNGRSPEQSMLIAGGMLERARQGSVDDVDVFGRRLNNPKYVYNPVNGPHITRMFTALLPRIIRVAPNNGQELTKLLTPPDPHYMTSDVLDLAHTIHHGKRYDLLPHLADALEEAGFPDHDKIAEMRAPNVHKKKYDLFTHLIVHNSTSPTTEEPT